MYSLSPRIKAIASAIFFRKKFNIKETAGKGLNALIAKRRVYGVP